MSANQKLLEILFYSPNTQFTSIKSLYEQVKKRGITYDEVKEFVQKQETTQLFKRQKRISHYFPIVAKHKYEIMQLDLIDMSDIASANEKYKFLLACIDVFSRLAYIVPMKNKESRTVNESIEEIIELNSPIKLQCDNGKEFDNHSFKKIMKENGIDIQFVDVGDHKRLGIVDRFVRTLREKMNKYMAMFNTTKYIDVLPKLISNYNSSYHSGIKKVPNEVEEDDKEVIKLTNKKYNKAKLEEIKFNVGDSVRYILNRKQFEKGTLAKWSKSVHKIISNTEHSYTLDNEKVFKYYELQKVKEVERLERPHTEPTREQLRKQRTSERRFRLEGLDKSMILIKYD